MDKFKLHKIVIVGGGAGGLELATKLGDTLGKRKKASITLIDAKKTHIWKPLLHEIAAGSLNPDKDELDYLAQGHWHNFTFRLGKMNGLNRLKKQITLESFVDDDGVEIIPERTFEYDTLIISVGSTINDFGVKGAEENTIALDTQDQAERFHKKLHNSIIKAQTQSLDNTNILEIVIVGAGATGVELAAELHKSAREMTVYGLDNINPDKDIKISLIEASERLLPALPERMSRSVELELKKLQVSLYLNEKVVEVSKKGVRTVSGRNISSQLVVWAAGIKAPSFLKNIDGLKTNHINQLEVLSTLQTTVDKNIFAFGDCAACPVHPGSLELVPPRAQSAHQQASILFKSMKKVIVGKEDKLPNYVYKDYGSLVNLGRYSTVGNLMGSLMGGSMFIEGIIARLMYLMLYQMHLMALHGIMNVIFRLLAKLITRRTETRVKLH
ncbi:MAG: FAD-dependent oxidoreductase [Rhodobacteraceae bacterium]|nr:FAD-dependent oxidoreductase [Paracoccaceae bacterium]